MNLFSPGEAGWELGLVPQPDWPRSDRWVLEQIVTPLMTTGIITTSGNSNMTVLSFRSRAKFSVSSCIWTKKSLLTGWLSGSFLGRMQRLHGDLWPTEPEALQSSAPAWFLPQNRNLASEKMEKRASVDKWPVYTMGI